MWADILANDLAILLPGNAEDFGNGVLDRCGLTSHISRKIRNFDTRSRHKISFCA
jgi:hypothetical protein